METEAAVTAAVETVAQNIQPNRTAIIAAASVTIGVVGTLAVLKVKRMIQARLDAVTADENAS